MSFHSDFKGVSQLYSSSLTSRQRDTHTQTHKIPQVTFFQLWQARSDGSTNRKICYFCQKQKLTWRWQFGLLLHPKSGNCEPSEMCLLTAHIFLQHLRLLLHDLHDKRITLTMMKLSGNCFRDKIQFTNPFYFATANLSFDQDSKYHVLIHEFI